MNGGEKRAASSAIGITTFQSSWKHFAACVCGDTAHFSAVRASGEKALGVGPVAAAKLAAVKQEAERKAFAYVWENGSDDEDALRSAWCTPRR